MRFPLYPIKIATAVCLPALAALFLGLFAVSRLDGLASRSRFLETARLPRADLAVAVERRLLLASQAIRGYALTNDRESLERAKKDLAKAADALHDAKEAAARPGMEDLAAEAEKIGYFLDTYKKAAEASVVGNERVAEDRAILAKAAEAYGQAVAAYAEFKTAQWDKELSAKYPAPETLRQHARRLKTAQVAQDAGRDVKDAAETARAGRDPAVLAAATARFDAAESALRDSKGNDEDAKRLGSAFGALADYRQAVTTLLTDWEALRATGRQILEAERAALAAASELGGASLAETAGDAGSLATALSASRFWLGAAGWAILLLGLGFAVAMALVLGLPVRRLSAFARDLSVGRLTGSPPTVTTHDEVGELADSLREMARHMGKRLAR